MAQTMEKLEKMDEAEYTNLIRVLFGLSSPTPIPENPEDDPAVGKIEWFDPTLNDSQKDAIRFALASREIALIHGPPGVTLPHFYPGLPNAQANIRRRPEKPTPSSS